jgi:anaerobic magnesium-protoporphyrin IX monomethyl ester cyclase
MKIAISYPPIVNQDGQKAMVSQNRNVQFFKEPTYLLPVIHGQAATWLRDIGYDVLWDDGNSQLKTFDDWYLNLITEAPDIIIFESTTPVMKFYWAVANKLKTDLPHCIIIMTGYHSMRKPEETLRESSVDIVLRSNHVDFVLQKLIPFIDENNNWRNNCLIEGLVFRRDENNFLDTGNFKQIEPLDLAPDVDRDLVQWKNYAYENGNFLQTPGVYATSVVRDCMFGKCSFCRYNGPDLTFSMRSVQKSLDEYQRLIEDYGAREIFDDSGVWYRGAEAREFAQGIIDRGLHKKDCYFGFNTRFGYLDEDTISLLAKANFRFILVGLEAADEETLNRLNKGYGPEDSEHNLKLYTKYGLFPHLTIMVGYYWQNRYQLEKTIATVKRFMFEGIARTLQVTLCTPIDFTPYHQECLDKKVLLTDNYDDFDMSKLIVKTPLPHNNYYDAIRKMYSIAFHPKFIFKQLQFLARFKKKDWQFLFTYGIRAIRRVRQHIFNLTKHQK